MHKRTSVAAIRKDVAAMLNNVRRREVDALSQACQRFAEYVDTHDWDDTCETRYADLQRTLARVMSARMDALASRRDTVRS